VKTEKSKPSPEILNENIFTTNDLPLLPDINYYCNDIKHRNNLDLLDNNTPVQDVQRNSDIGRNSVLQPLQFDRWIK